MKKIYMYVMKKNKYIYYKDKYMYVIINKYNEKINIYA